MTTRQDQLKGAPAPGPADPLAAAQAVVDETVASLKRLAPEFRPGSSEQAGLAAAQRLVLDHVSSLQKHLQIPRSRAEGCANTLSLGLAEAIREGTSVAEFCDRLTAGAYARSLAEYAQILHKRLQREQRARDQAWAARAKQAPAGQITVHVHPTINMPAPQVLLQQPHQVVEEIERDADKEITRITRTAVK